LTSGGRWWKVVSEEEKKLASGLVHFIATEKKWPDPTDAPLEPQENTDEKLVESSKVASGVADALANKIFQKIDE
jgi:hypothetical protein